MALLTKKILKRLAEDRIRDAQVLLQSRRYAAAYYMAGYAIECSIKAVVAGQTRKHDFPDRKFAVDSHTHDLAKLIALAGLNLDLNQQRGSNAAFAINWNIVKDWSEVYRYQYADRIKAQELIDAITDNQNGVLAWIKSKW